LTIALLVAAVLAAAEADELCDYTFGFA